MSYKLVLPDATHKSKCENGASGSVTGLSLLKDLCFPFVTLFRDELIPFCELLKPPRGPFLLLGQRRFLFCSFHLELKAMRSSSSES